MKNNKTALMIFSASLALAAPLAFAQQAVPVQAQTQTDATAAAQVDAAHDSAAASVDAQNATQAQAATPAVPPTGDTTQQATPAAPVASASGERKWSDLDGDGNGHLSVTEAASMPSLAKVFTEADADADGQLTQDEYKAWLASNKAAGSDTDNGKAKGKTKRGG